MRFTSNPSTPTTKSDDGLRPSSTASGLTYQNRTTSAESQGVRSNQTGASLNSHSSSRWFSSVSNRGSFPLGGDAQQTYNSSDGGGFSTPASGGGYGPPSGGSGYGPPSGSGQGPPAGGGRGPPSGGGGGSPLQVVQEVLVVLQVVQEVLVVLPVAQEVLVVPQAVVIHGVHQILGGTSLVITQPLRVSTHICSRII